MLSIKKQDFALNKEVLRAVLNGVKIDMTQPCELWKNDVMFGYEMIRDKKQTKVSDSQQIGQGSETGSEEDMFQTDYPSDYPSDAPDTSDEDKIQNFKQQLIFGIRFQL